jgi:hypothetical protein
MRDSDLKNFFAPSTPVSILALMITFIMRLQNLKMTDDFFLRFPFTIKKRTWENMNLCVRYTYPFLAPFALVLYLSMHD